jgi:HD-like signal output (HDOD) protein
VLIEHILSHAMVDAPYAGLDSWVAYYSQAQMPVLRHTVIELEKLRGNAEFVNGRVLSSVILQDPLMTLRVLGYIESHRRKSQNADITTIERALMMIGIEPFFREFQNLPLVEDTLKPYPKALLGLLKVIARARHASHWARDWAIIRHDLDVDEITVATLLYDVAEILMWCFAPKLALQVRDMQVADRTLRSVTAQQTVYNITLPELQTELTRIWHLPDLLATLMDRKNAENQRVRNVTLAVDLARHSANGWDDAALPDDYSAIEDLLHISHDALMQKLGLDTLAVPTANPADNG